MRIGGTSRKAPENKVGYHGVTGVEMVMTERQEQATQVGEL